MTDAPEQQLQALWNQHEKYLQLEQLALAGDMTAETELLQAVRPGMVEHFKLNAEGGHNQYRVEGVFRERTQGGEGRYFVRYVPLYANPSAPEYRRLLVGMAEGEEDGWLLPVEKPEYKGPRFFHPS